MDRFSGRWIGVLAVLAACTPFDSELPPGTSADSTEPRRAVCVRGSDCAGGRSCLGGECRFECNDDADCTGACEDHICVDEGAPSYDDFDPTPNPLDFGTYGKWTRVELTWRLVSQPEGLDAEVARAAVGAAFAEWALHSGLRFTEVAGAADIELSVQPPGDHGDSCSFASTTLAHAFFPNPSYPVCPYGQIHVNPQWYWTSSATPEAWEIDLQTVLLHEIGHALGLQHSAVPGSVMEAMYAGARRALTPDDLAGIQSLYPSGLHDCDDADVLGCMTWVPAGTFWEGCHGDDCPANALPYRLATLSAEYWMGKYEVTVAEYLRCVAAGGCPGDAHAVTTSDAGCNAGHPARDAFPMNCVTWRGAQAYCTWLGARLPTEAEWEHAARGSDGQSYPWGDAAPSCTYAVMDDNGGWGCGADSAWPVGSKPAGVSPFGLLDMAGNAEEWASDWYDANAYASGASTDPSGPGIGTKRVVRGGGFAAPADRSLAAWQRAALEPGSLRATLGFRCAR